MNINPIAEWMLVLLVGVATLEGVALRALVRRIGAMRRSRAVQSRMAVARLAAGRKQRR